MKPTESASFGGAVWAPYGLFVKTRQEAHVLLVATFTLLACVAVLAMYVTFLHQQVLEARDAVDDANSEVARASTALENAQAERRVLMDSLICRSEGGTFQWSGNPDLPQTVGVVCTHAGDEPTEQWE